MISGGDTVFTLSFWCAALGDRNQLFETMKRGRCGLLVACSSYLKPSLTGGGAPVRAGCPFERLRLFLVVQFNELQMRLINPPNGIADIAPDPASIKRTLVC